MKRVLIFGAKGMAGHIITMYLENLHNKYEVFNVCHNSKLNEKSILLDILDIEKINQVIESVKPEVIINCIGILNKTSDINKEKTSYVNTFFPKLLERLGQKNEIKIIHLSTDCVFSGKNGGYKEDSFKDEEDIYGLSKNLGEIINHKDLTFRMSIVGPELNKNGTGLFHWFMNQKGNIKGFTNVYWTGVTTLELAKAIDKAIDVNLSGLYHLVPSYKISKYELINIFKDVFKKEDIIIEKFSEFNCDKSLVNTKHNFAFNVTSYEEMVIEMQKWISENKSIYGYF